MIDGKESNAVKTAEIEQRLEVLPEIEDPVFLEADFLEKNLLADFSSCILIEPALMSRVKQLQPNCELGIAFNDGAEDAKKGELGLIEGVIIADIDDVGFEDRLDHLLMIGDPLIVRNRAPIAALVALEVLLFDEDGALDDLLIAPVELLLDGEEFAAWGMMWDHTCFFSF